MWPLALTKQHESMPAQNCLRPSWSLSCWGCNVGLLAWELNLISLLVDSSLASDDWVLPGWSCPPLGMCTLGKSVLWLGARQKEVLEAYSRVCKPEGQIAPKCRDVESYLWNWDTSYTQYLTFNLCILFIYGKQSADGVGKALESDRMPFAIILLFFIMWSPRDCRDSWLALHRSL